MKYNIRDYYANICNRKFGISYRSFDSMESWGNHWHDCCELELILSGEGIHVLNGREYPFSAGTLFVLTTLDCHTLVFDGPVKLVNAMLEDSYISGEIYEKLLVRKTMGLENNATLSPERAESVKSLVSVLYNEYSHLTDEADGLFEAFVARMIDSILIELLRELKASEESGAYETPTVIGRAILYIHAHYCEKITLSDVAAEVHLSSGYFSELFKKATGQNFKSYLIELRIKNACRMLTKTDKSITDICFACGFESFSNFMRTFKAKHGMSPLKYRQNSQSEEMQ